MNTTHTNLTRASSTHVLVAYRWLECHAIGKGMEMVFGLLSPIPKRDSVYAPVYYVPLDTFLETWELPDPRKIIGVEGSDIVLKCYVDYSGGIKGVWYGDILQGQAEVCLSLNVFTPHTSNSCFSLFISPRHFYICERVIPPCAVSAMSPCMAFRMASSSALEPGRRGGYQGEGAGQHPGMPSVVREHYATLRYTDCMLDIETGNDVWGMKVELKMNVYSFPSIVPYKVLPTQTPIRWTIGEKIYTVVRQGEGFYSYKPVSQLPQDRDGNSLSPPMPVYSVDDILGVQAGCGAKWSIVGLGRILELKWSDMLPVARSIIQYPVYFTDMSWMSQLLKHAIWEAIQELREIGAGAVTEYVMSVLIPLLPIVIERANIEYKGWEDGRLASASQEIRLPGLSKLRVYCFPSNALPPILPRVYNIEIHTGHRSYKMQMVKEK